MSKYLDENGLLYFWQKIKNTFASKATTLSGYGITNAYTKTQTDDAINAAIDAMDTGVTSVNGATGEVTLGADDIDYDSSNSVADELTALLTGAATITFSGYSADLNNEGGGSGTVNICKTDANTLNTPYKEGIVEAYTGAFVITFSTNANNRTQVAFVNASRYICRRGMSSGTWQTWVTMAKSSDIPTKLSQLTNDGNYVADASYVHTDSNFTSDEKSKLSGIAAGANKTTVDSALSSSSTNPLQNKAINTALGLKAPLASPTFTGTPKGPTAAAGTNTTQLATTAFVTTAISNAQVGAATFKGTVSKSADISGLTAYKKGWYWVVSTAGTYAGEVCEAGDMIFCVSDYGSAYAASDFSIVQNNITTISNSEIDTIVAS